MSTSPDEVPGSVQLIDALQSVSCYPHPVSRLQRIETHASWVILTGEHVYKFKKPVNLGFLDYTTLEKRHRACLEELRLNRMLAPQLYLDVVPVTGSINQPRINGEGQAIEYAVHMHQFEQASQFDRLLAAGRLGNRELDEAADYVAAFHAATPVMTLQQPYGLPADMRQAVLENFAVAAANLPDQAGVELDRLNSWSEAEYDSHLACMESRRREGFVRECHGDLHLANLARYQDRVLAFDRIEFNESFRWLDVMNDSAFLIMDLLFHDRSDLAFRFLNRYLQQTGDYEGLALLRYYTVYRAMVRAKVAVLRRAQLHDAASRDATLRDAMRHIRLATSVTQRHPAILVIMHGVSGSGKTWVSDYLMSALPAIRLRSDVERKRLHGLDYRASSQSPVGGKLYTDSATLRTYERLCKLTASICNAGYAVIVDAACLSKWQRSMLADLARELAIPWLIVNCRAPESVLRQRLQARLAAGHDASEADLSVLEHQLEMAEPLDQHEIARSLDVDTSASAFDVTQLPGMIHRLCQP